MTKQPALLHSIAPDILVVLRNNTGPATITANLPDVASEALKKMADDIRCVSPVGDICGEGVVWHPEHRAVYWTDINRFLIHRMNLEDESTRTWIFHEPVTALNLTTDPDRLLVVFASCVALWSPRSHPCVERISNCPRLRKCD